MGLKSCSYQILHSRYVQGYHQAGQCATKWINCKKTTAVNNLAILAFNQEIKRAKNKAYRLEESLDARARKLRATTKELELEHYSLNTRARELEL